jgi:hypothetical protein
VSALPSVFFHELGYRVPSSHALVSRKSHISAEAKEVSLFLIGSAFGVKLVVTFQPFVRSHANRIVRLVPLVHGWSCQ